MFHFLSYNQVGRSYSTKVTRDFTSVHFFVMMTVQTDTQSCDWQKFADIYNTHMSICVYELADQK
jgi:hypothetical protein